MYNPCEQCPHAYPICESCSYFELQRLYLFIKLDLKRRAQCETCAYTDCANKELYTALDKNCIDWKYKEEPR